MNDSTAAVKNFILELIYKRKLEHEKELQPLYDQLVRIESLKLPKIIIENSAFTKLLMDAQKSNGTEFSAIDSPKEFT